MKNVTEGDVKLALKIWKQENPEKGVNDILKGDIVVINKGTAGEKEVDLGVKITYERHKLKKDVSNKLLEKRKFWIEQEGLILDKRAYNKVVKRKKYRLALEIWKQENPGKGVNDISQYDDVILNKGREDEEIIHLGQEINTVRQALKGKKLIELTTEERIFWLEQERLIIDKEEYNKNVIEETYKLALETWKKDHPGKGINDIPSTEIVTINKGKEDEEKVYLGSKISHIKQKINGTSQTNLTDEEKRFWVEQERLKGKTRSYKRNIKNKKCVIALEIWKKENPGKGVNDVKQSDVIVINKDMEDEEKIYLGIEINTVRQMLKGKRKNTLTQEETKFWVKQEGLIVDNRSYKQNKREEEYKLALKKWKKDHPGKGVNDISTTLEVTINEGTEDKKKVKLGAKIHRIEQILKGHISGKLTQADIDFWIEQEGLIVDKNIYQMNNENEEDNLDVWIYDKYGKSIKQILLLLGLNADSMFNKMKKDTVSLEEAIAHSVFRENVWNKECNTLEKIYTQLVNELDFNKENIEDVLAEKFSILIRKYDLEKDECNLLRDILVKYIETIKKCLIADVGLTEDEEERIEKIVDYNLDKYDIEESYLVELNFSNGVLLGKKSDIYLRRQILRSYIIDWNYYTDKEKELIIGKNYFSLEELKYIVEKREEIDYMVGTIKKLKKDKKYKKQFLGG